MWPDQWRRSPSYSVRFHPQPLNHLCLLKSQAFITRWDLQEDFCWLVPRGTPQRYHQVQESRSCSTWKWSLQCSLVQGGPCLPSPPSLGYSRVRGGGQVRRRVRWDRQEHSQPQQHRPMGERCSFSGKAGNWPSAYIYFVFFKFSFAINTWILKYTDLFCILCFTAVELPPKYDQILDNLP